KTDVVLYEAIASDMKAQAELNRVIQKIKGAKPSAPRLVILLPRGGCRPTLPKKLEAACLIIKQPYELADVVRHVSEAAGKKRGVSEKPRKIRSVKKRAKR
ncbi:MAG: hypothetical protein V2A66_08930, partial [Pseudomonadota bacterium]